MSKVKSLNDIKNIFKGGYSSKASRKTVRTNPFGNGENANTLLDHLLTFNHMITSKYYEDYTDEEFAKRAKWLLVESKKLLKEIAGESKKFSSLIKGIDKTMKLCTPENIQSLKLSKFQFNL